ncbi:uncharacterized protein BJX67DRAFT_281109 [Aspergillus lucknowensis]|uniref:Uncharacterized protein n=1 Tax=Aspergillus lucknowensis TaxID=176173 RepID=A0ABR4M0N5_9EURO
MASINTNSLGGMDSGSFGSEPNTSNTQVNSPFELQIFLSEWAAARGQKPELIGNCQTLWELLQTLGFRQRDRLQEILGKLQLTGKGGRDYLRHHDSFHDHLSPTLANFLLLEIALSSREVRNKMSERQRNMEGDELLRYKIEVIRDSFLWLNNIIEKKIDFVKTVFSGFDKDQERLLIVRLACLSRIQVRDFSAGLPGATPLEKEDKSAMESLWKMFDGFFKPVPVRLAFRLASVGVAGGWGGGSDAWSRFLHIFRGLSEDFGRRTM